MIARTREGKAAADELHGSTFTITNLGMYDIDSFSPHHQPARVCHPGHGTHHCQTGLVTLRPGSIDEAERCGGATHAGAQPGRSIIVWWTVRRRRRFLQRVKQLVEQPYLWLVA